MLKAIIGQNISNKMAKQFNETVSDILATGKNYVIWGAGATGANVTALIKQKAGGQIKERYVVDNNAQLWGNNNVQSPEYFSRDMWNVDIVLVCVYVSDQIVAQLNTLGYKGEIIVIQSSVIYIDEELIEFYKKHVDDVESVYEMVEDELSQKTLEAYFNVLFSGDLHCWNGVNGDSGNRFPKDIIRMSKNEKYVDIGAFTGDTLEAFLTGCGKEYESIVCIEPDSGNYERLSQNVAEWGLHNVKLLNIGVGIEKSEVGFVCGLSESSQISQGAASTIQVLPVDCVPEMEEVTILKISTNGYDMQALLGARETIKRNKPQIAVYCRQDLLWRIPYYLKEIVPEYKIYIRHFGQGLQALMCYATI